MTESLRDLLNAARWKDGTLHALEVFDVDRGCIRSPTCEVRQLGEACTETGLCGMDSVCCVDGGASLAASCVAPRCDDPSGARGPPRPRAIGAIRASSRRRSRRTRPS